MKRHGLITAAVLLIFVSAAGVFPARAQDTLMIAFTANTNGQLLDCGCGGEIAGGLPRRGWEFAQLRKAFPQSIFLDGGDFLATVERELQNAVAVEAYRLLDYDAVGLGEQEFWNGRRFWVRKVLGAKLPFLCANLILPDSLRTRVRPAVVLTRGTFHLRVIGLLSPQTFLYFDSERKPALRLQPPAAALERELERAKESELIAVIYHGDEKDVATLRKRFPRVLLWFVAHQEGEMPHGWSRVRTPAVVFSSQDGSSIELLKLTGPPEKPAVFARRFWLTKDLPRDKRLLHLVENYYQDLRENLTGKRQPDGTYRGSAACRHCHLLTYESWQKTAHAGSLKAVAGRSGNCNKCHAPAGGTHPVDCEACHAVSARHGEWDFTDRKAVAGAKKCRRCHTRKWSPRFEFQAYWRKIAHSR